MTQRDYRTRVNSPSGTIADSDTFTFDRASRMLTAANGRYSNTVTYTYDPIGRKATESLAIASRTYTTTSEYNSRGELTKVTYPDNSISERTYHDTGALHLLKLDGSTISTRTYDDGRRLTGETLGNGVTETRTYSTDNLLTGISYGGTGTSIGNLSYTWDANKNKTSETIGGTMSGYGFTSAGTSYDDEDRLTGYARASGTFTQAWNLTPVGDWNSITTNGTAQNRTHGPTHELLTAGGQNINTDVKGNITVLPANLTPQSSPLALQWDFDNKLKAADLGNNSSIEVNFQYDALGRRVARLGSSGSFVFVQHDQQTIADYGYGDAPSSPLYRYVYASYIDEPVVRKAAGTGGTIHYYHRNQQYSITAMTTSTGAVAERYAYTAYGQPTILNASGSVLTSSAIGNRYTYTGREWDETLGLHHFRARWMSPLAGRFLSRDPIGRVSKENALIRMPLVQFVGVVTERSFVEEKVVQETHPYQFLGGKCLAEQDSTGLLFGWGYGNYCGFSRRGQNGPPIDFIDAACKRHDSCQPYLSIKLCYQIPYCSAVLCQDAWDAYEFGCAYSYPGRGQGYRDCQRAASDIRALFCTLSFRPAYPGSPYGHFHPGK
jgi:RHS repeat-associated protein